MISASTLLKCLLKTCICLYPPAGKFISVFLPISAFAALGLEHAVANMFLVPMGKAAGANITWSQIWLNNLLPVTLGNTIAGSCLMALPFALIYGRLGQPKAAIA